MEKLNILFLTDLHYIGKAKHTCTVAIRKPHLAARLLHTVFERLPEDAYDMVVLGGDLTDNGRAAGAMEDLCEIKQIITRQNKPVLVVRGNHDAPEEAFRQLFEREMEPVVCGGYQVLGFSDHYQPGVAGQRDWTGMENAFAALDAERKTVVFQHSPIYPPVVDTYPYNLLAAEDLMAFYQNNRVLLSVSGHLHRGMPPVERKGVVYMTGAALCEAPFSYSMIRLAGGTVSCEQLSIAEAFE